MLNARPIRSLPVRLAATALALLVAAAPLRAETLADALAFGYEHSGVLEQNRALLRVADEDVAQAVAGLRPILSWSASHTVTGAPLGSGQDIVQNSIGLVAEVTLWDGGRSALGVDAARETVLATRYSLVQAEQEIFLRIVQAYTNLRSIAAFVDLRENNVRLITQELRAAQDRFEVGEVTRTDVAQAEALLAAARSELAAEQGNLARAQAEYTAAVGRAPRNLAAIGPVRITQGLAEAQAQALRSHPGILQVQHSVAAAEIGVRMAERAANPTLSLNGRITTNFDLDRPTQSLGVSIGGPIYQGGNLASNLRQIMARRDSVRAQLHTTSSAITQNVANAYSYLEVARASKQAYEQQVRAASIAFEGIREEAQLGARTTLDVLDAEQTLLNARVGLISAEINETVASYSLLAAMGRLTARDLQLNVQIYDPEAYYNLVERAPVAISEQGRALDRVLESIGAQ